MTKMTATVQVEFELLEGQATNTADTALIGGIGALKLATSPTMVLRPID
jgi:hypothetical protein